MNEKPNVVAIVEARMTSSRLPGKHMLKANGKPMLQHLIDRLKQASLINRIVIATTTNEADEALVALAKLAEVDVYRGSEEDVMGRVVEAGQKFAADVICEVTGDCPIIDPVLVDQVIKTYLVNNADYVNNGKHGVPGGMNVQVFSWSALKKSADMTQDRLDREHVTLHIKRHPEIFQAIYLVADKSNYGPEFDLTLDELNDYNLLNLIIEHFGERHFGCGDIIQLLQDRPEWVNINKHVVRKGDA